MHYILLLIHLWNAVHSYSILTDNRCFVETTQRKFKNSEIRYYVTKKVHKLNANIDDIYNLLNPSQT